MGPNKWFLVDITLFDVITVFLSFRAVFVHFAKNKTHPLFLSKFHCYLIFGPKKWFSIDITFFKVGFVK